jgi:hypothetical protein
MLESLHHIWGVIPPGTFIAILGFLAAIMAFFDPPKKGFKRFVLIVFLFLLMVGEIFVLRREQRIGEDHFTYVAQRFDNTDKLIKANQEAQARVAALPPITTVKHISPTLELKRKATILSAEILHFLTDRQANEPSLPRPETWKQDTQAMISYMQQTLALYSETFGSRVIAVHDEFARQGLRDGQLDSDYGHPTNPIGIRIVGERIGTLAEKLKQ